MKNRSKILTFGLIVLIIFTGVIYAQNQKTAEETNDKFEITENKEESSALDSSEQPEEDIKTESDVSTELTDKDSVQESDAAEDKSQELEPESDNEDSAADSADRNAGMIEFEELIAAHPETEEINEEYQAEKEQLKEGENKEENLEKLNETYTSLLIEKTRTDLIDFAEAEELDLLVVNDQIVLGEEAEEEELPELKDQSQEFKDFLNN